MADSMSYLYTIGGYAALLGLGYVDEKKKKKQRMATFASEAQESSRKAPKPEASGDAPEQAWLSNTQEKADDVDNIKFAKQLAKAQSGTKFASKSEGGKQREKSVKQSRANKINVAAEEKESAPSSTTGADADDDQSPITSPEVGPAVAGDVSDMLEATAARPAVLRLTDTAPKQQKPKAAKAPEPVETKKQRQNRKKAEAAKIAREESEKDRKVLEEKQRRTARIAEGRAAKDGSQFMAANGSKSSWTQGAPSNKATPASETNGTHQPLDTFEPATTTAKPATTAKSAQGNWISSLPSEEEQMEMLKTDEDEWSTVKTKTKSKKNPKTDSSVDSGDEPLQSRPSAQPKQAQAGKSASTFGSFSALSTKDEPVDEQEVEEEWEV
ncbi:hypothetical protein B0J13DRAFT_615605 [Dactylonectria estremocensis]|uniref:Uncharacterized protein n=1 Tax=Dactylonectria estremocensis TaxID=1079267 RepID=A0A9P9JE06_9HYPO|nr:hypothetical protein B0J13DRAFT_615605 [Dactylonectria estremocensis]